MKYRWCDDAEISPPHCPFDEVVIRQLKLAPGIGRAWTKTHNEQDYRAWVLAAKILADKKGLSIPEWELEEYESALNDSRCDAKAAAEEFARLSRQPQGNSQGWKFNREEIHERR